jgi:ferrous iron transport protein B
MENEKAKALKSRQLKVALVGKPNCGKSTLFNVLTGLHQRTGNFPGVTVDKKTGTAHLRGKNGSTTDVTYIDLPGTYSLYPKSPDEKVAFDVLTNPANPDHPDAVILVADATNLKRCLFITTQVIDLGIPCVLALNMMDELEKTGQRIDTLTLALRLGIPVAEISAREKTGIGKLEDFIAGGLTAPSVNVLQSATLLGENVSLLRTHFPGKNEYALLLNGHQVVAKNNPPELAAALTANGFNTQRLQSEESLQRHAWIGQLLLECSGAKAAASRTTQRIDRVLTHPVFGYLIFLLLLLLMFQAVFTLAQYPMDWIEQGFVMLGEWLRNVLPQSGWSDLLVDGVLAGMSGVAVFIPQIAFLFAFIALLEDTGYMARVSFIMDKLMRRFGLNGRSVIPLIGGMACAVPAIMSARTIPNWKERLITIMITPLMSCSARLPVYTLLISLVVPDTPVLGFITWQGIAFMGLYLLGFVMAMLVAIILKYFVKVRERSFFIMELPVYRLPQWRTVLITISDKIKVFLFDAGKIIIGISIVLWILAAHAPGNAFEVIEKKYETELAAGDPEAEARVASEKLEASYAGHLGKFIEPAIAPLGYDWKIGISLITSFAAREVFVGTMATIYGAGNESEIQPIRERMRNETDAVTGKKVYSTATGFSLLIFYAFALQCMSTIAVVKRETRGWKWPIIQFVYMSGIAYFASLLVYQLMK